MKNCREDLTERNDSDNIDKHERQEKKSDKWNESLFDSKGSQHLLKLIKNGKLKIKN